MEICEGFQRFLDMCLLDRFFVHCQRFAERFQSEAESEKLLDFVLPKCSSWVFKVYHESPNVCKCFLEKFMEVCFKCS